MIAVLGPGCRASTVAVLGTRRACITDDAMVPAIARRALADYHLGRMQLAVDSREVTRQARTFGGDVCFGRAIRLALESLVADGADNLSPRAVAQATTRCTVAPHPVDRTTCYLDDSRVRLRLASAARGELSQSWVFVVDGPDFWPHAHIAVVGRQLIPGEGPLVRNYGVFTE